jgi:hypothetical protein
MLMNQNHAPPGQAIIALERPIMLMRQNHAPTEEVNRVVQEANAIFERTDILPLFPTNLYWDVPINELGPGSEAMDADYVDRRCLVKNAKRELVSRAASLPRSS